MSKEIFLALKLYIVFVSTDYNSASENTIDIRFLKKA